MESIAGSRRDLDQAVAFFAKAGVTTALIALASLALDDITTDNAVGFKPEYGLLAASGAWSLFLAYDLLKKGHRRLGVISVAAVASVIWVSLDGLGHKRDGGWGVFWPEYTVVLVALLWFLALGVVLVALGQRCRRRRRQA